MKNQVPRCGAIRRIDGRREICTRLIHVEGDHRCVDVETLDLRRWARTLTERYHHAPPNFP